MKQTPTPLGPLTMRWLAATALSAILVGCGGGSASSSDDTAQNRSALAHETSAAQAPPTTDPAAFARSAALRSAALSSADLAAAEQQAQAAEASNPATPLDDLQAGQIAPKSAYTSGAVVRKAAAVRIPAYRFSNSSTGAHFFTTSETERADVINTMSPPFSFEGVAFSVASAFSPGLSSVHRFYNTQTGVHFYTISETERANVAANFAQFSYEGVAYYASQVAGAGLTPFYRFFVPSRGFHFYTANEDEKNSIIANLAITYSFEGIGYYVLDTNWRAEKLPHSGITSSQCYQSGSYALVACSSNGAINLNPQQDGHRATINPMGYSELPNPAGGNFPRTSCVKDDVTGLVWEGKNPVGERSGSEAYTNFGDGTTGDASAYVNRVNQLALCGYTDWRLPQVNELLGILDYGITSAPFQNASWFPNPYPTNAFGSIRYWSAEGVRDDSSLAWATDQFSGVDSRGSSLPVRLVRGSGPTGPRYSYSTVAYGSDGANNLVNDAWTGLQWRRCEEGRVWSGSACTGTATPFNHQEALIHAKLQSGWRLPHVKELSSLIDLGVATGNLINGSAFPGTGGRYTWTSSPSPSQGGPFLAWQVSFGSGDVQRAIRSTSYPVVRLVRINP